jgi:hypothetical protein
MIVVPPVHAYGSPAALELGQRLANVIHEYRASRPGTSGEEVRQALRIAGQTTTDGADRRRIVLVVAVVAALAAMVMPIVLRPAAVRPGAGPWVPLMMIGLVAAVFLTIRAMRQ